MQSHIWRTQFLKVFFFLLHFFLYFHTQVPFQLYSISITEVFKLWSKDPPEVHKRVLGGP